MTIFLLQRTAFCYCEIWWLSWWCWIYSCSWSTRPLHNCWLEAYTYRWAQLYPLDLHCNIFQWRFHRSFSTNKPGIFVLLCSFFTNRKFIRRTDLQYQFFRADRMYFLMSKHSSSLLGTTIMLLNYDCCRKENWIILQKHFGKDVGNFHCGWVSTTRQLLANKRPSLQSVSCTNWFHSD